MKLDDDARRWMGMIFRGVPYPERDLLAGLSYGILWNSRNPHAEHYVFSLHSNIERVSP